MDSGAALGWADAADGRGRAELREQMNDVEAGQDAPGQPGRRRGESCPVAAPPPGPGRDRPELRAGHLAESGLDLASIGGRRQLELTSALRLPATTIIGALPAKAIDPQD